MGGKTEACGRCSMTTVVDAVGDEEDEEDRAERVLGGGRIEVDEDSLRKTSPGAWLGSLKTRLDDAATRLTYGR